ncbi:YslB family protein [Jeotgalibacillus soli]|uniref:DUF2507 domain-containing protein n=1 Tax=Jeotgalibacillus soli TaxID=889306 RepID=A0A0C2VKW9_9BACL|nr:YslB family protein [Jeotgalibacillus soli]KIL44628.1 hypothetical protein KP78_35920 [Jeotgalibacillus soli]
MSESSETPKQISLFGYSLIRDVLVPELLGTHTNEILYWAGKNLARKYAVQNEEELIHFFKKADWGNLQLVKQRKEEIILELTGPFLEERMKMNQAEYFTLEAGFLAEQYAMLKQYQTEAIYEPQKRKATVQFVIKWDSRDPYELPSRKVK